VRIGSELIKFCVKGASALTLVYCAKKPRPWLKILMERPPWVQMDTENGQDKTLLARTRSNYCGCPWSVATHRIFWWYACLNLGGGDTRKTSGSKCYDVKDGLD